MQIANMHELIRDIALCTAAAWLLGLAAQIARQPIILAYLAAGFILGPSTLSWVTNQESIATISELGLIFMLFMIGLEIDLKKIISAGKSITVTALVQIFGGFALGTAVFRLLGFKLGTGSWDALYLGAAAALSSTVIIVKVLYEKRELDTLPGRVTLGVLVLQDLFAILFLAIQPNLNQLAASVLLMSLLQVGILVGTALLVSKYVLPPLFQKVARLPELILVGAIGWCFLVGEFAERLHLSREMGALVAGVALSTFPYALDVTAKVTSLRDFFVTLFFVGLGMKIQTPGLIVAGWALALGAFTVVSRVVTTFTPLYILRQGLRASLLPAINLAQISEFSLVLLELGASDKFQHVGPLAKEMTSLTFVILAAVSTFGMVRSDGLIRWMIPHLKRVSLRDLHDSRAAHPPGAVGQGHGSRILFLGFFQTASSLLAEIERNAPHLLKDITVVDFNPVVHAELKSRGIPVIYGDISQRDTLLHAGIANAQALICTVPDSLLKGITNEKLVRSLRELNPKARIIAPAEVLGEAPRLIEAGASYVCMGRLLEGRDLLEALHASEEGLIEEKRSQLVQALTERREVLP
jgi:Kef-type K+ transport system membrane component KefB/voltage-gated potassium channel Kch